MSSQLKAVSSPWRFGPAPPTEQPFRHFQVTRVLDEELASRLLGWLETTPSFIERTEDFYRSSAFHISPRTAPPGLEDFFSPAYFQALIHIMSESFALSFADQVILSANHYGRGQGTLIHTDYEPEGRRNKFSFTHRFLIYLNRGWKPEEGGALGLFSGPDQADLAITVPPAHNSGVALEIGPRSYHAVAAVQSGHRYSLNFTLAALERS